MALFPWLGTARAFSVPNHVLLTLAALDRVKRCVNSGPDKWKHLRAIEAQGVASALVGCNLKQDEPRHKFRLWHFYKGPTPITGTWTQGNKWAGATSFDDYFAQVADRLTTSAKVETIFPTVGALIHYVQDAAVPAHAVPIYHPSPLWNGDNFDGYPIQGLPTMDDAASCGALLDVSDKGSPLDVLADAIDRTRAAVMTPMPPHLRPVLVRKKKTPVPADWTLFWDMKRDAKTGFAEYGCVGDKFGVTGKLECRKTPVEISEEAYVQFARERQQVAVEATVRLLAWALRARPAAQPLENVACPVAYSRERGHLTVSDEVLEGRPAKGHGSTPEPEGEDKEWRSMQPQ